MASTISTMPLIAPASKSRPRHKWVVVGLVVVLIIGTAAAYELHQLQSWASGDEFIKEYSTIRLPSKLNGNCTASTMFVSPPFYQCAATFSASITSEDIEIAQALKAAGYSTQANTVENRNGQNEPVQPSGPPQVSQVAYHVGHVTASKGQWRVESVCSDKPSDFQFADCEVTLQLIK